MGELTIAAMLDAIGNPAGVPPALLGRAITGLAYDSRRVEFGNVFAAIGGAKLDGRQFARQALDQGAVAILSDLPPLAGLESHWISVPNVRRALGQASAKFYAESIVGMRLAGVTGTNGKTTTATLLNSILRVAGFVTVLIGTIHYLVANRVMSSTNTTPESVELFRMFAEGAKEGARFGVMEVSSHALAQERVAGIHFDTAGWTNLTQDHLDFHHGSMEEYFEAKHRLFTPPAGPAPRFAVLNADDAWARKVRTAPETQVLRYSAKEAADLRASSIEATLDGLRFDLDWKGGTYKIESALAARVNVHNILCAFGMAVSLGIEPEAAQAGIAACKTVDGRFERVDAGQPFAVIVDYAHTDDALRNTLETARALKPKRIITVFGCGGDRDRTKRPLMGQAAGELSGLVVVTSDNPRSEDPLAIINDILVGLRRTDAPHYLEPDRSRAIRRAISAAGPGDLILIAGKGHETYQILKDRTIDFDDRAVALSILEELGYGKERV
jgi:UDP-N-acetylmuramoyl-L-alanyl-D-glutamate--2,6-diaminopimelate ligase